MKNIPQKTMLKIFNSLFKHICKCHCFMIFSNRKTIIEFLISLFMFQPDTYLCHTLKMNPTADYIGKSFENSCNLFKGKKLEFRFLSQIQIIN